jgi:hypothetical protein
MRPARFLPLGVLILIFAFSSLLYAAVPQMINYQGKITTPEGALIDSAGLSMVFSIYDNELDPSPAWAETLAVDVEKAIFSVVLGNVHPLSPGLFDGTAKYLGVKAGTDPEMTPRKPIVSVPYAMNAGTGGGGGNCEDCDDRFVNVQGPDSVVSSGSGSDATFAFWTRADNTGDGAALGGGFWADSSSGTGLRRGIQGVGRSISSSEGQGLGAYGYNFGTGDAYGVIGWAEAYSLDSWAWGGWFKADTAGSVSRGIQGNAYAFDDEAIAQGVFGWGENTSSGNAYGGTFIVPRVGTGDHYGVMAWSDGSSDGDAFGGLFIADSGGGLVRAIDAEAFSYLDTVSPVGVFGWGENTSAGGAYGGLFRVPAEGTGEHTGILVMSDGSSDSTTHGIWSSVDNSSAGAAIGGLFQAWDGGTGDRYGIMSAGFGASDSTAIGSFNFGYNSSDGETFGTFGFAKNDGSGSAYGGFFEVSSDGMGDHYGVRGEGYGGSSYSNTYGCYGYAENTSGGRAYGGFFVTSSAGTAFHYGVRGEGYGESVNTTYGFYGYAENTSSGIAKGGYFEVDSIGTGSHYGIQARAYGNTSSYTYGSSGYGENSSTAWAYGVYGDAKNTSTGTACGGRFYANVAGTGTHYAVRATAYGNSSATTYGVYGTADSDSSGSVYGGYFSATGSGSGTKVGVYASGPLPNDWAGYFSGDVRVTNDLYVTNNLYVSGPTKSAIVKVDNGEYRALYCMESPESWFEDFGGGRLQSGATSIQIDPLFAQTVDTQIEYRVFLTPEGNCKGLYVTNKTSNSFEVRELQGGNSNITFSYRIVAKRKGNQDVRLAKVKVPPALEAMEAEQARLKAELEEETAMMEQDRQRLAQEQQIQEQERQELQRTEAAKKISVEEQREKREKMLKVAKESRIKEDIRKAAQKKERTGHDEPSKREAEVR